MSRYAMPKPVLRQQKFQCTRAIAYCSHQSSSRSPVLTWTSSRTVMRTGTCQKEWKNLTRTTTSRTRKSSLRLATTACTLRCETENSKETWSAAEMQRLSFAPFIVGLDCSDAQLYLLATRLRSSYVCSITFAIICAIYKQVPCIPAFATPHFHSDQGL